MIYYNEKLKINNVNYFPLQLPIPYTVKNKNRINNSNININILQSLHLVIPTLTTIKLLFLTAIFLKIEIT